ncbi:hypothetical protein E1B28_007516 [Marasmius oreades]|uniref:RING-type E3 ubiquitin transferase n=1 Tax=Marasmius oreades TaxID=181124 RepID=A0A9P7S2I3_9AGAR|nr:uncharacterized protein E1B28_007516 [Marasmius oreades]KAG7093877.1 hypothetical protein E1B28_007516 [Marasmius oreades]
MDRPSTSKSRGICKYYTTPRGCFSGKNCKFLHADPEVDKGVSARLTSYDQSKTCRYYARGYCKRAEKCWFLHTLPRNQVGGTLDIHDVVDPIDELCSICFEKPSLYGLLAGCSHVFCITCIKRWRDPVAKSLDMVDSGVHKKCPMCRSPSSFITPSSLFYTNEDPRKSETIKNYKESMARVPCKYFLHSRTKNKAKPICPFGKDCFYQHLNDDGTPYLFRDGVEASMRRLRQPLFSHINLFADIFESVRRDEDGNYDWINRLLEEPNLAQLQDTLQAVRDSLQEIDRANESGEERSRRNWTDSTQNNIVVNASVLPGVEAWNLDGERPSTSVRQPVPISVTSGSLWPALDTTRSNGGGDVHNDGDDSDHSSLPALQDVEDTDSDDAWSTTDGDSGENTPPQDDLSDLRRAALSLALTMSSRNDHSGHQILESVLNDQPPQPISDENAGLPALELTADEGDEACESEDTWPRPPFVTDGRGRVIGASDGNNGSASVEVTRIDGGRSNGEEVGEDLPRTILGRFMNVFF